MIMMTNRIFIRKHINKALMDSIQIEMFIFIIKLLKDELKDISQKDQTSS